MTDRDFNEPFDNDEMERNARALYDMAIDQGSGMPKEQLLRECRQLVNESLEKLRALGNEPAEDADDDSEP